MDLASEIIFIIVPVLTAGISFIFFLKLRIASRFAYPLDLGITWNSKPIFGKNKTARGPVIMGVATMLFGVLVDYLLGSYAPTDIPNVQVALGFLLVGLSYSIGELPNSFAKRRLGIPPGQKAKNKFRRQLLLIIDTFDSLIACGIVYRIVFHTTYASLTLSLIIGGILHLFTDRFMQDLRLK